MFANPNPIGRGPGLLLPNESNDGRENAGVGRSIHRRKTEIGVDNRSLWKLFCCTLVLQNWYDGSCASSSLVKKKTLPERRIIVKSRPAYHWKGSLSFLQTEEKNWTYWGLYLYAHRGKLTTVRVYTYVLEQHVFACYKKTEHGLCLSGTFPNVLRSLKCPIF